MVLAAHSQGQSTPPNNGGSPWTGGVHLLTEIQKAPVALIPYPRKVVWESGGPFQLPAKCSISCESESLNAALSRMLAEAGIAVERASENQTANVQIRIDPQQISHSEAYHLAVGKAGVIATGHDAAGAFYAIQTLRQMLRKDDRGTFIPLARIEDSPAFPIRGFMHDTGRNFQSIESLKRQLDHFAAYKLNTFHWHLTDNPAWRPESRIFPQLNEPKFRKEGRDPDKTYTFEQIRDVIRHARERHIRIIPELDMPGHSAYFNRTFGFGMGTPQGMEVLEKLIDEFCAEIPQADCPIIHLGADEVHIPNPEAFIQRMTERLRKHGRTAILWNPGLRPVDQETMVQIWGDQSARDKQAKLDNPVIDSAGGYLNSYDPLILPMRYFFWQACGVPAADVRNRGGILCMWPDIRVDEKINIFRHSPVWPTLLAFSESIWLGRTSSIKEHLDRSPVHGSGAWQALAEFEARMADHRERFFANEPFIWIKQSPIRWSMRDVTSNPNAAWKPFTGTTAQILNSKLPIGTVIELRTTYHVDAPRTVHFWIGFDYIGRSHRESGGIPEQGKWDANGCDIRINGLPVPPPVWKNPGQYRFEKPTWEQPPNEIPLTDEELYWCREPVAVELKQGANLIEIRLHKAYANQGLQATCAPVRKLGTRWVEDETVRNSAEAP